MRAITLVAITSILTSHVVHAQSLQEQGMCADQARKTFQEDSRQWDIDDKRLNLGQQTISLDYQSHYNTKLKRCLILTTRVYDSGGHTVTSINLYDANERRDYGYYLWQTHPTKKYWEVPPISCQLVPNYGQTNYCKSQEEFDAFVTDYMNQ
jgi:hypothetical protein